MHMLGQKQRCAYVTNEKYLWRVAFSKSDNLYIGSAMMASETTWENRSLWQKSRVFLSFSQTSLLALLSWTLTQLEEIPTFFFSLQKQSGRELNIWSWVSHTYLVCNGNLATADSVALAPGQAEGMQKKRKSRVTFADCIKFWMFVENLNAVREIASFSSLTLMTMPHELANVYLGSTEPLESLVTFKNVCTRINHYVNVLVDAHALIDCWGLQNLFDIDTFLP